VFWILHGADEFRRAEFLAELKATLFGDAAVQQINTTVLDGSRTNFTEIAHACGAIPFMGDKRLVIVEGLLTHLGVAKKGKRAKKNQTIKSDDLSEDPDVSSPSLLLELTQYLDKLPEATVLVFLEAQSISPNHPLCAMCQASPSKGQVREFRPFLASRKDGPGQLAKWTRGRAKKKGIELSPDALQLLVTYVGDELRLLDQELDKLSVYASGSGKVSASDVRQLVTYVREADIFDMVDALGRKDVREATALLHRLLDEGKAPLYLLAMVVRQFRVMIQVKELNALGFSISESSRRLGLHEFVIQKGLAQARNFTFEQLSSIYDSLAELDAAIKTGKIGESLALDLLVAEIGAGAPLNA